MYNKVDSHYPNLLTSQFIATHYPDGSDEYTTVIKLQAPYWTQTPTIHLTASRLHYMIQLVDELVPRLKLLETQVQKLNQENDELRKEKQRG
uniref:DUF3375 domain-containing protein n=1 Tax=Clandestinovirus TaxID=2831644 RepID=A0A8F8KKP0_9VIRU|nr:DUF3375 domain-containing protein [Clandestinovirus]